PKRQNRCDFEGMLMPDPSSEIDLIETFAKTKVIGLTINHENMTDAEVSTAITRYEEELEIPSTDALTRSPKRLVEMVLSAFPQIGGAVLT
ncbi:NAD-dependent epimerase/dehydratase family protein, partial [Akkermansiaceae bacterium]|nr:NAD-dependent epimerase/dehydratase family protein [Akkermansiaceae bacterium]